MIKWIIIGYVGYFLVNILKDMFYQENIVKEKEEDVYFVHEDQNTVDVTKESVLKDSQALDPINLSEAQAEMQFQEAQSPDDYEREMKAQNEIERREEILELAERQIIVEPIKEDNYVTEENAKTIQKENVFDVSKDMIQKTVSNLKEIVVDKEATLLSQLVNQLPN